MVRQSLRAFFRSAIGLTRAHRSLRPRRTSGGSALASVQPLEQRQLLSSAVRAGTEFQVNTYTTASQRNAAVAMDADGDYVVTWQSTNQDTSGYGVYAQRYNAAGVAQGSEFQVHTVTANSQGSPAIAMDSDGDFVIVWDSGSQDGSSTGVYAQRFNSAGVAQGSEFRVNTFTTNAQSLAAVAMDADGDFVIAWGSNGQDGSGYGIFAQRYNAAGVAQGSEFQVNTYTTSTQGVAAIAMDAAGNFVVSWNSSLQDSGTGGVYAQRFNSAGVAQGSEFQVNTYTTGTQSGSAIAMDSDGDFVIAWQSSGQDGSSNGIYAQRYNSAGVAQGTEFRVNTYTTSNQNLPAVSMDADGDFVIAWSSSGQDGSSYGIYAQRYSAAGVAQGNEFLVNTYTTDSQTRVATAMDADGGFVVAWDSTLQDGNSLGIYAQRYDLNLDPIAYDATASTLSNRTLNNGRVWGWDPEELGLTYSLVGSPVNGSVNLQSNGTFSFTPTAGFIGTASFQFQVTDPQSNVSNTATMTVNVLNRLPIAYDLSQTILSNTTLTNSRVWAWDPEGQALTYALVGSPVNGSVNVNSDGTFSFTPTANFAGTASFQFQVTDSLSGVSNTATVTITVQNRLPVAYDSAVTMFMNRTLPGARVWGWDPEAQTLTYSLVGSPVNGSVNLNSDGTFSFTPTANFAGTASFQFQVTDTQSGVSNTATMTITVENRLPIAYNTTTSIFQNQPLNEGRVWGWDPEGQALTYAVVGSPVNGTVNLNSDGTFSFTPTTDFVGVASFQFQVTDTQSGVSNTATMTINVNAPAPDRRPIAAGGFGGAARHLRLNRTSR
jgi:hypothetical protein